MYLFFRFVCKNVAKVLFAFERAHLRLLFFTLIPGIKVKIFTKKIHFFFCESTLFIREKILFVEKTNDKKKEEVKPKTSGEKNVSTKMFRVIVN